MKGGRCVMYHPYFDHEFYSGQLGYEESIRMAAMPRSPSPPESKRKKSPLKPVLVYGRLVWM
jgi:hypothetical protein